jgi:cysteine desulfurase/selenocysteine lyase
MSTDDFLRLDPGALTAEISRMANAMFAAASPTAPAGLTGAPDAAIAPGAPAPVAPPPFGPSAINVGAGGASPSVLFPPVPGPLHALPLAATPPPRDSDLRSIPVQLGHQLGVPDPLAVVTTPAAARDGSLPYFLQIAGMPAARGVPSAPGVPGLPAVPGAVTEPARLEQTPHEAIPTSDHPFTPELVASSGSPATAPSPARSTGREPFDPHALKRDFPILADRVNGRQLVWLDNAATTQKPNAVIDRLSWFYQHENSNVHRAAHTLAARATDAYESARDKVRRFLNAPSPKEILFVRGATEGINLIAKSWGRRNVEEGDEIVITWLEHHANIVPWQQLCSERGARLRVAPVDDRGQIRLDEYEKLLGSRTKLVSLSQVSNALGTITPAAEMVRMAHRHGACVVVDGAQAVSHMPVDVQALDCDFYVFSGHKVFGPTGIGVVYGKSDILEHMPPWQGGGNMIADVTFEKTVYQGPPARFEAGTGNIADAVGLGAALDYISGVGLERVQTYEHELLVYAEKELDRVPGLRMIGTAAEKAGVLSFTLDGQKTEEVGGLLDREGIAVRSGHHCAQPILRRFGVEATVRASLAPYNTHEDIDALVAALLRLQTGRPPGASGSHHRN